jgi:hypothetical protein
VVSPQLKEAGLHNPQVSAGVPNGFVSRSAVRLATGHRPPAHRPSVWMSDLGLTPLVVAAKMTFPKLGVGCSVPFYGPLLARP